MFWLLALCAKLLHNLVPPSPQSSSLGFSWDALSLFWNPKNFCWLKHNSKLLGCAQFLSQHFTVFKGIKLFVTHAIYTSWGLLWWLRWYKIHLPMQETWVWSPGQEDPLEKEMATHSRILAWEISRTEVSKGQTQLSDVTTTTSAATTTSA